MNTPTHIAVNLLLLGRQDKDQVITPIILGAILPDLSMFTFYFFEKVILGTPETIIWSQSYYQAPWQNLSALSNSIPLGILGLLFVSWKRSHWGFLLFSSILLHLLTDLPLHNEDAHRHFFPLSDWRFYSPISYWDPSHYGNIIGILEIILVSVCCVTLLRTYDSSFGKFIIGGLFLSYLIYEVYVIVTWL